MHGTEIVRLLALNTRRCCPIATESCPFGSFYLCVAALPPTGRHPLPRGRGARAHTNHTNSAHETRKHG